MLQSFINWDEVLHACIFNKVYMCVTQFSYNSKNYEVIAHDRTLKSLCRALIVHFLHRLRLNVCICIENKCRCAWYNCQMRNTKNNSVIVLDCTLKFLWRELHLHFLRIFNKCAFIVNCRCRWHNFHTSHSNNFRVIFPYLT